MSAAEREEESGAALGGKNRLELLLLGVPVRPRPCDVGAVPAHALGELLRLRRTRPEQMPHVLYRHGGVPWVLVEVDLHLAEHPVAFEHVLAPVRNRGWDAKR